MLLKHLESEVAIVSVLRRDGVGVLDMHRVNHSKEISVNLT